MSEAVNGQGCRAHRVYVLAQIYISQQVLPASMGSRNETNPYPRILPFSIRRLSFTTRALQVGGS